MREQGLGTSGKLNLHLNAIGALYKPLMCLVLILWKVLCTCIRSSWGPLLDVEVRLFIPQDLALAVNEPK